MKTLLTIILTACFGILTAPINAQTFGVKGGLNLATSLFKDDDETYSDEFSSKAGLHVGGFAELPITDLIYIEPSLLLETKGFRFNEAFANHEYKQTLNTLYLDIPVLVKAGYTINDQISVNGGLGPYFGLGLTGKAKREETFGNSTDTEEIDIEWGSDSDKDLKRFDFGLAFGANVEYKRFLFGLTYDLGLANIIADRDYGMVVKNRVFRISVGYKITK